MHQNRLEEGNQPLAVLPFGGQGSSLGRFFHQSMVNGTIVQCVDQEKDVGA